MLTVAGGCRPICFQQHAHGLEAVDELRLAQINDQRGSGRKDRSKTVTHSSAVERSCSPFNATSHRSPGRSLTIISPDRYESAISISHHALLGERKRPLVNGARASTPQHAVYHPLLAAPRQRRGRHPGSWFPRRPGCAVSAWVCSRRSGSVVVPTSSTRCGPHPGDRLYEVNASRNPRGGRAVRPETPSHADRARRGLVVRVPP